jgi:competence protein ComEC
MIDGVSVSILNPPERIPTSPSAAPGNNDTHTNALVVKATLGRISFLFPSDISAPAENRILTLHDDVSSQIALVPHHGSYSSSTADFIEAVQPEIAVISCGREDYFRNLHPDVIKRYKKIDARIFRTDINGAIRISTDGYSISTSCFK